VIDTGFTSDRRGGRAIVAGEHPDLETEGFQLLYRDFRFGTQRVSDRDEANRLIADGNEHRRGAGRRQYSGTLCQPVELDAVACQERLVAQRDLPTVDARLNASALDRLEVLRLRQLDTQFARVANNGLTERMLSISRVARLVA